LRWGDVYFSTVCQVGSWDGESPPEPDTTARIGLGGGILDNLGTPMGRYRRSQIFANAAFGLLVFCMVDFRPLLAGGLFKLIASLALACLLAFVVVHSADICRLIMACVYALPVSYFPLTVDRRWGRRSETTAAVSNEPALSPLFQRPPPIFPL